MGPSRTQTTYKNQVSGNCCITHSEQTAEGQDWGMATQCNAAGPFTAGNPALGGGGCTNAQQAEPQQLTLCKSV
jgi:hypothetical protein